jgi:FkbM family methyltransferase
VRYLAWKGGDALAAALSALTRFRIHDEPLQPFAIKIPMLLGIYEKETINLVRKLVKPGSVVIDGGAHAGYFTLLFSKLVGRSGKVLAFEIHPKTLQLLRHNTRLLDNVEVLAAALGAADGTATLFESSGLSSSHSATATKPGLTPTADIPMRSVKSVLDERGLARADFVKLDVEGGEPAILRSLDGEASAVIFEIKRYILESAGQTPEDLLAELMDRGFELARISGCPIMRSELNRKSAEWDKANILALRRETIPS